MKMLSTPTAVVMVLTILMTVMTFDVITFDHTPCSRKQFLCDPGSHASVVVPIKSRVQQ